MNPLANRETRTAHNYALAAQGIPAKVCSQCLETKPLAAFGKYASASDGLKSYCRACRAANHARRYATEPEYKAQHNASSVRWQKANTDRVHALAAARIADLRVRNSGKVPDPNVMKRCAGRCGQMLPETSFRFDRGQRDGLRATCRNCTSDCRRRCRKAHGDPQGQICYLCGEIIRSASSAWVDHVVPRSKGGGDEPENLRWTHDGCNMGRQNNPLTAEQVQRLERPTSAVPQNWPPRSVA
jgi:hypothetical protein